MKKLLVLAVGLWATPGFSETFLARETAAVGNRGDYSVGVFAPLDLGLADGLELRAHPILFLLSPNLDVRVAHVRKARFALAGEYGFSVPTLLLRMSQGFLFPTTGKEIPWAVVPHAGARASFGSVDSHVWTLVADVAVGVPFGKNDLTPVGTWPFLEMQVTPLVTGIRGQLGALYDHRLSERVRLRGYVDAFLHRAQPSVLTIRAGLNVDVRVGRKSRLTFGGVLWNADQHAIDRTTMQRVRSTDFLPTVDFIWAG